MRRLLTLFLCLLPVVAQAQTGTVISGDQVMVGGRRLTDALALKADAAPLAAALLSKADRSTTTATAANKVDLSTFTSALAGKVDVGTYSAGLSTKADQAATTAALATKADAAATATALGLKANSTDVATSISSAVAPLAPIASPTFTGTPKAPTQAAGDSSAKIATTAYADGAVATGVAPLAPKASPAFTGAPTVPTPAFGTETTQVASTAFVGSVVFGRKLSWFGAKCDATSGTSGTDDTAAIQQAINWNLSVGGRLYGEGPNKKCRITSQLLLTQGQDMDFGNTVILPDTTKITSGAAILLQGGTGPKTRIANLREWGPNVTSTGGQPTSAAMTNTSNVDGVEVGGTSGAYATDLFMDNVTVLGFRNCLLFTGANNYIHTINNPTIGNCWVAGIKIALGSNSGENFRIFGGTISGMRNPTNSPAAIAVSTTDQYQAAGVLVSAEGGNSNVDLSMFATSLDYSDNEAILNGGSLTCVACHIEDNTLNPTFTLKYIAGGSYPTVKLFGGIMETGPGGYNWPNSETTTSTGTHTGYRNAYILGSATAAHYRVVVEGTTWNSLANSLIFAASDRQYSFTTLHPQMILGTASTAPKFTEYTLLANNNFATITVGTGSNPPTIPGWAITSGTPALTQPLAGTANTATSTFSANTTDKIDSAQSLQSVASTASNDIVYQYISVAVNVNDQIYVRTNVKTSNQTAGKAGAYAVFYAQDGSIITATGTTLQEYSASNNSLTTAIYMLTVPAGATRMAIQYKETGFIGTAVFSTAYAWRVALGQ